MSHEYDTPRICIQCATLFLAEKWKVKKGQGNLCSQACLFEYRKNDAQNFWKRVKKTDTCWLWIGARRRYGRWNFNGRQTSAHQASWRIHYGEIPKGLFICHRCDNTFCVRPDHLFLGTCGDNVRDSVAKGRWSAGHRKH